MPNYAVQTYDSIFDLINMQSFSSIWYWMALAVVWSVASYFLIGAPYDMYRRAKSQGGEAEQDLLDMVRIYVKRVHMTVHQSGLPLMGVAFFVLTSLAGMGFYYGNELSQAVFLIAAPLGLMTLLNIRNCYKIQKLDLLARPEELYRLMWRYRLMVQIIGVLDVTVASLWGITVNLSRATFLG